MKTATAKKLVKNAGLTFSTQDERFYSTYRGNFWFFGESRMFPKRARFYIIQGLEKQEQDEKLSQLSSYLISLGYQIEIRGDGVYQNDCIEILNLNEDGVLTQ